MDARQIPLKNIGKENGFRYKDVLIGILSRPLNPQAGIYLPEIRKCNKVLDKLDSAGVLVILSEDEWQFVKERVENFPYGVGGKEIEQFADDIINAEKVKLEVVK